MISAFFSVRQGIRCCFQTIKHLLRRWTKPTNDAPVLNIALDLTRSKTKLVLENAILRQQLVVLNRHTKRPPLSWRDRALCLSGLQASHLEASLPHRPA